MWEAVFAVPKPVSINVGARYSTQFSAVWLSNGSIEKNLGDASIKNSFSKKKKTCRARIIKTELITQVIAMGAELWFLREMNFFFQADLSLDSILCSLEEADS